MMKVALPEWNGRISPVFDSAGRLIVVRIEGGAEVGRESLAIFEERPGPRAMRLSQTGVSILICGALSNGMARAIDAVGITVIPWIAGDIDEVIAAFVAGTLDRPAFRMPGCGGGRMRRGRCGCEGRGRGGPAGQGGGVGRGGGAGQGGRGPMSGPRRRSG
jgi:predicted Fe-Mo cluster-binding NifX family protein